MSVPVLKCSVTVDGGKGSKAIPYKEALLSLKRNPFHDLLLRLDPGSGRGGGQTWPLIKDSLIIHRKFIKEGKMSLSLKNGVQIRVSNAPPHQCVIFIKSLASKLTGEKKSSLATREKLLAGGLNDPVNDVSPITSKDVHNYKKGVKSKEGLLGLTTDSPQTPTTSRKQSSRLSENSPLTSKTLLKSRKVLSSSNSSDVKSRLSNKLSTPELKLKGDVLTSQQKDVLNIIKQGQNLFFTGGAGTGKSFLIRKIIGTLPPNTTFITASTGMAAYQIGGMTLHSFAGIGAGTASLETCYNLASRKGVSANWKKCCHLIVDEISMVDGQYFTKLEKIARLIRGNDKPFGGIQLILTGDFLQLPPVTKKSSDRLFCFQTATWNKCIKRTVELDIIKRQTDSKFVNILKSLRIGVCTPEMAEILKMTHKNVVKDGIIATQLCTHSDDVTHINNRELEKLPGDFKTFDAIDSSNEGSINVLMPVDAKLKLKLGSQVMLMKNLDVNRGLVNGARGVVTSFSVKTDLPMVKFKMHRDPVEISMEKFICKNNGNLLVRNQLPLKLAWAFSIHKSQGMTLDCVEVSLTRVFEVGQAYVALSRAKDLKSIRILDFTPNCIQADKNVVKFYRDLKLTAPILIEPRY